MFNCGGRCTRVLLPQRASAGFPVVPSAPPLPHLAPSDSPAARGCPVILPLSSLPSVGALASAIFLRFSLPPQLSNAASAIRVLERVRDDKSQPVSGGRRGHRSVFKLSLLRGIGREEG